MAGKYFVALAACFGVVVGDCGLARPPTAHFQVLSYSDVYEMMNETDAAQTGVLVGGPSRVIPLANKLRQTYENNLVIFAGDTMAPSLWSGQFKGLQMIEAHNALGVDFACLGNHEFDFGIDGFLNVSAASKFPWLNANAYEIETKQLLRGTAPYVVKTLTSPTMGTIKIGAFGVMYDMQDSSKGIYWTDPIAAAKEQVKKLREVEKVDLVIALTHQFQDQDNAFSQQVKGVDIIYGGHDHTAVLQTNFGTPFLKSDLNFRSIWVSDIKYYGPSIDASNKATSSFTKMSHKNLQITNEMPSDPAFDAIIATYDAKIQVLFNRVVGSFCADTSLQNSVVRKTGAPIGNFFADAFTAFYKKVTVDVGIMNGGGIRTDKLWKQGQLTVGDIISWSPFGNIIAVISTDGESLKKFLMSQLIQSCDSNTVIANGFYPQVAGIHFDFVCTGKSTGHFQGLTWAANGRSGPVQDGDTFNIGFSTYLKGLYDAAGGKATYIINPNEATRIEAVLERYIDDNKGSVCPDTSDVRSTVTFGSA
ncbi:calcineurin-like phosphoesterase [Achlya hypogyna]|uniref:Calcineurin-like phosphoesterase n=1 Tax=Achlya hypogyna TaxID=1202772 RepID=A0A0A7CNB7_ACHHY|nr:secreted protein [Achlya hypogyna]OQS00432.1 calcineurin-like phosphoesterase [Achlya hypogyna]